MSRDKQIEEMAKIIDDNHGFIVSSVETAEALYNAGYRKSTELAEEIFAEIETIFDEMIEEATDQLASARLECDLKAVKIMEYGIDVLHLAYRTLKKSLKKKYTEEGK